MAALRAKGRVVIEIEKRLPVQGGLGGASGNAVATLLALERALKKELARPGALRIAAEVGSDLPLFLVGGTVLGVGRGEEVYPLPDLPAMPCVVATPEIAVSTPKAFADWDQLGGAESLRQARQALAASPSSFAHLDGRGRPSPQSSKLTGLDPSDRMLELGRRDFCVAECRASNREDPVSLGVEAGAGPRPRFSTSSVPGLKTTSNRSSFRSIPNCARSSVCSNGPGRRMPRFPARDRPFTDCLRSRAAAAKAAARLRKRGIPAVATTTLTRRQYWEQLSGFS